MMHTRFKFPLALLLVLFAPSAWGGDESVSDHGTHRWAGLFSDHGSQAQSKQTASPLYQTSLTATVLTLPMASPRLRDLAPETNQARTQGFLSSTTWLNGVLVTETEVAQNQGGAG